MILNSCDCSLSGFYEKSEGAFLGEKIDFRLMTPKQLDQVIVESITLYNQLYPPPPKKRKFMTTIIKVGMVAGIAAFTGGTILAAYGVHMGTIFGAIGTAAKATVPAGSLLKSIQTGASAVAAGGAIYGKITGDTPEELIKAAGLIKSENALDAMELIAKDQLNKKGMEIQAGNEAADAALRERLKKEQQQLSDKMMQAADEKARMLGQPTPQPKKISGLQIASIATPFILYFMS